MSKSLYFNFIFMLYGVALMVCGGCRILLKLFHTDLETGFYTINTPLIWIFNILLLVVVVLLMLLNRLKSVDNDYPIVREGRGIGFLAILSGLSLALYTLENTGWIQLTRHSGTPLEGIKLWICGVLGLLAALSFFTLGLMGVFGYRRTPNSLIVLFPAVWQLVLLVSKFNNYTTLTTVPDHLLAVLFMVFASMFIIGHARTLCGFNRKDGRNYTIPTGLITSLMGFLLVTPNYVYMVAHRTLDIPTAYLGDMESIFVLCFSFYALGAVISLRKSIAVV